MIENESGNVNNGKKKYTLLKWVIGILLFCKVIGLISIGLGLLSMNASSEVKDILVKTAGENYFTLTVLSIVLSLIGIISLVLILMRKKIGVVIYFITVVADILAGFMLSKSFAITSIILPTVVTILLLLVINSNKGYFENEQKNI